jgi:hypothetical protein
VKPLTDDAFCWTTGGFFTKPELNPSGSPPILRSFECPPGGGERISPGWVTTSKLGFELLTSLGSMFGCFDFRSSLLHVGCSTFGDVIFGDSGFDRALSNQLALVGLHRLGSIVFVGLDGSSSCELFDLKLPPPTSSGGSIPLLGFSVASVV